MRERTVEFSPGLSSHVFNATNRYRINPDRVAVLEGLKGLQIVRGALKYVRDVQMHLSVYQSNLVHFNTSI